MECLYRFHRAAISFEVVQKEKPPVAITNRTAMAAFQPTPVVPRLPRDGEREQEFQAHSLKSAANDRSRKCVSDRTPCSAHRVGQQSRLWPPSHTPVIFKGKL